jgi:hypothetical protein
MTAQAAAAIDRRSWNVTLSSEAAGSYNADGDGVPGAPSSTTIKAVVQPAKGSQLIDVPEGIRAEAGWIIWSRSEIKIDNRITSSGKTYRVLFVWDRSQDGDFYRAALGMVKT